jgi:hypothetical protein
MRDERDHRNRHDPDPAVGSFTGFGEPTIAPGRRTLTDRLSPRQADAPAPAVQRKQMHRGTDGDPHRTAAEGTSGAASSLPYLDQIQASFGRHDVSSVAAYADDAATAACDGLGAMAFASGNRIAFRGPPTLHTAAHEAAHVVQQRAGVFLKDGLGDTGDIYEKHADVVAEAVVRGESAEALLDAGPGGTSDADTSRSRALTTDAQSKSPVQLMPWMGPRMPPSLDGAKRALYVSLVTHPVAKLLLGHYIDGTGAAFHLTPQQMIDIEPIVDVRGAEGFEALVLRLRAQTAETQQPAHAPIPFAKAWGGACASATLGNFTVEFRGGVSVWPSGVWRFTGAMSFYDFWDFDGRDDDSRTWVAELKTRLGGAVLPGAPFHIFSAPVAATQTAYDRHLQWAGGFEAMSGPDITRGDALSDGNMRPKLKREGTIGELPLPETGTGEHDVSADDSDD